MMTMTTLEDFVSFLDRSMQNSNPYELVWHASERGCRPLELFWQEAFGFSGTCRMISDTSMQQGGEIVQVPVWMSHFYEAWRGFIFRKNTQDSVMTRVEEFWLPRAVDNWFKYNRLSWVDTRALAEWIARGEIPMVFPGPYEARYRVTQGQSMKLLVSRSKVRVFGTELQHDPGLYSTRIRDGLQNRGIACDMFGQFQEARWPVAVLYQPWVSQGARVELDTHGIEKVADLLRLAFREFNRKKYQDARYAVFPDKGFALLDLPPELVADFLGVEALSDDVSPWGRSVPTSLSMLSPMEQQLHEGFADFEKRPGVGSLIHRGKVVDPFLTTEPFPTIGVSLRSDLKLAVTPLQYRDEWKDEPRLAFVLYRKGLTDWVESLVVKARFLGDVVPKAAAAVGLTSEELARLPWQIIDDKFLGNRFDVSMKIVPGEGDEELFVVQEPGTGFLYYAAKATGTEPHTGRVQGRDDIYYCFEPL